MKKIAFILFLLSTYTAFSQILVDDVNINDTSEYIKLYIFNAKKIYIDYGQKPSYLRKQVIKNKEGLVFIPNGSPIAVINFIAQNGYEYIDNISYYDTNLNIDDVTYIFKRKD